MKEADMGACRMHDETQEHSVGPASTDAGGSSGFVATGVGEVSTCGTAAFAARRPYQPAQLRPLGKVAELTFGGAGSTGDGKGNYQKKKS
jgi:hypothetical protein